MRPLPLLPLLLATLLPLLAAACGGDDDGQVDLCRGVTCPAGHDCVDGVCRERQLPEPPEGCEVNADCFQDPGGPFCDRATNSCVACLADAHCSDGRQCQSGVCAGSACASDGDCGGATPWCNPAGDACVACLGDDHCEVGERCNDAGACVIEPVSCTTDAECREAVPSRPLCHLDGGQGLCVQCRDGGDCEAGVDCVQGMCVDTACTEDADCAHIPSLPVCGDEGSCVACTDDAHCPGDLSCEAGACVGGCTGHDDCAGSADGPWCEPTTGACVPCLDDGHCPVGERCDDRRACVGIDCEDHADCPVGARCDEGLCVDPGLCEGASDCTFDPRAPACNEEGRCVACTVDAHCDAGERCQGEVCVPPNECASDGDCPANGVCSSGLCVSCRSDAHCPRGVCQFGACVDAPVCAGDADCAVGVCDAGSCVACITSLDCGRGAWCEAGACVPADSCTTDADCGTGSTCQAGSCSAASCSGAEEPNELAVDAHPIAPGVPVAASLCSHDVDWFVFAAAAGVGLDVDLLAAPAGTKLFWVHYDTATGAMTEQEAIGSRLRVRSLPQVAQGRHYLRVEGAPGVTGSYGLLVSLYPSGLPCGDRLEPNDTRHTPASLAADGWARGLDLCGDEDFYRVEVPASGTLRVTALTGSSDLRLEIFSGDGATRLASGQPHGWMGGGVHAVASGASGPVLVKVSQPGASDVGYDLHLSTAADAAACGDAPVLLAGGERRARVRGATLALGADHGASGCGGGGPDRAYRLVVDEPRRLVAAVEAPFAVALSLRDGACTTEIACGAALATGRGLLEVLEVPAGTYTLIVGGGANEAGPFELAVELLEPTAPRNDLCSLDLAPISLLSGSAVVSGTTALAGSEGWFACTDARPDVFHAFHFGDLAVAESLTYRIEIDADGPAMLGTGAGCTGSERCSSSGSLQAAHRGAGPLYVGVTQLSDVPVHYTLTAMVVPPDQPQNACSQAASLAPGDQVTGFTTWASDDHRFGSLQASCTGYWADGGDHFYALSLAANQEITATLTPSASYDASLYVLSACGGSCLAGVDEKLEGQAETLRFRAPAAGTFYLVVDGGTGGGHYSLRVD